MTTTSGALSHVKKAYEYIERLSESDRSIYSCTRRTIGEIVDVCKDIIEIGTCLIEECPARSSKDSTQNISVSGESDINLRLDKLETYVSSIAVNLDKLMSRDDSADSIEIPVDKPDISKPNVQPADNVVSEDTKLRKQRIGEFTESFSMIRNVVNSNYNMDSSEFASNLRFVHLDDALKTLGTALSDWYHTRILELDTTKSPFRYSLSNIIPYTQSIIYSFSKAYMHKDVDGWVENFYHWLEQVKNNDASVSSYALPYEIFKIYKQIQSGSIKLSIPAVYFFRQIFYAGLFIACSRVLHEVSPYGIKKDLECPSYGELNDQLEDFESRYREWERNRCLGIEDSSEVY